MHEKHQTLQKLAEAAIERLQELPQPVVRLSGPLTSGGFGYDKNLERFLQGQNILREKGYTVFDYFEGHDDEEIIKGLALPWPEVMEHYHLPIMESGLIAEAFFLPHWKDSSGAMAEYKYAKEFGIKISQFPEEWFE